MNSDAKLKEFWGESSHFADLFNTVFFGGKTVILPETLSETDTALTAAVKRKKRKGFSVEKFRDVFMTWRGHGLAVLGIENQTKADYVLPERLLLYDALGYETQRRRIAGKHRREKSLKDPEVRKILKAAYCLRRKRIEELAPMSAEEVSVLAAFVNSERLAELAQREEEEIEMCTALEEMIAEGEERGRQDGLKQGMQRGTRETAAHMVRSMYKKGFDAEEIAGTLEWPLEKVKEYIR